MNESEDVLESLVAATSSALGEMAGAEVAMRSAQQTKGRATLGPVSVVVRLESARSRFLVLNFPHQLAATLAGRMLTDAGTAVDESLIRDCVGEIGNVIAGQAKAMLFATPHQFTFTLPVVLIGTDTPLAQEELDCLIVAFTSNLGGFALQLFWKAEAPVTVP